MGVFDFARARDPGRIFVFRNPACVKGGKPFANSFA
jgi:hypothetical protein